MPQDDKTADAFLYFSSNKRRLNRLLGRELQQMSVDDPKERNTRISFELDHTYDLMSSFPELYDIDLDELHQAEIKA